MFVVSALISVMTGMPLMGVYMGGELVLLKNKSQYYPLMQV